MIYIRRILNILQQAELSRGAFVVIYINRTEIEEVTVMGWYRLITSDQCREQLPNSSVIHIPQKTIKAYFDKLSKIHKEWALVCGKRLTFPSDVLIRLHILFKNFSFLLVSPF